MAQGIMRGEVAELQASATRYYANKGASPDEVAAAILGAIVSHS